MIRAVFYLDIFNEIVVSPFFFVLVRNEGDEKGFFDVLKITESLL